MGSVLSFEGICACSACQTDPDPNYAKGRRQKLKYVQHQLCKSDDIQIVERYIEIPSQCSLFSKCYIPLNQKPKGMVFLLEGYEVNIDRPDIHEHCLVFAKNGYITISHDNLGQGRSDGLWLYIPNTFDIDYVDNANYVHNYYKNILIRNTNTIMKWKDLSYIDTENRYFLCGRSMGGAVGCRLAMKYDNDYKGMILLSPMIGIDDELKPNAFIEYIFRKLVHWFPTKTWTPSGDTAQWMVSTENGRNRISNEHHMIWGRKPRLKTALELVDICELIQKHMHLITMDFIVMHGLSDKVCNPELSKSFYGDRKECCDATIKLYDRSYHMIWWEPCADKVYTDMITWLNEKCLRILRN